MTPIIYYKDDRFDYDYYDICFEFYNPNDEPFSVFDTYQLGYNYLGYETMTLVNIVWNGTSMEYFFINDEGMMVVYSGDDAEYITSNKAGYRLSQMTPEEISIINHLKQLQENRRQYEIDIQDEPVNIKKFKFLK